MPFTHLHVHTEYSLLDGAARIKDIVARAKELGMDSLAITDHGAMFGVIDFYKECRKQGIHPVIGCEVYTAARGMQDMDPDKDRYQGHLVLLAESNEGYRNLIKIVSLGYTKGLYYKPRIDKDVLRAHSKGIIALSACLAGRVQYRLLNGDYAGARQEALEMQEIFGERNFFLELQDQGLPEEKRINPDLIRLSEETGIPMVCTNDVHYVRQEDAEAHEILLCIQTATNINDEKRMRFTSDQFYLKSEEEMREIFGDVAGALENTYDIAHRCQVEFKFGEYHIPEFAPPEGETTQSYLRRLCAEGLEDRYEAVTDELRERLEYELGVIESMGYVEYFLIVWDFINYAKSNGIVVGPGRGSAAGSLVAYCLHITDIDPIRYSLIFERFLNPERVSMPDIDVDFCIERRGEVIDYVKRKYGEDNVSQIITFGTMKAKAVVRDVARALDLSYADGDRIAKAIPFDLKMTIDKALDTSQDLATMYRDDENVRKVIDMSRKLEGMPRHASTHAAGVVISRLPLDEYVPLYNSEKGVATQFNMTTVEELGLLKMDFLGLRNLTVIRDALEMIRENHGVSVDFATMGYDDPAVYEMIAAGNTDGIFQLESGGMTSFMQNLKPTCFEDVVAGISLYRPGPMDSIPKYIENKKHPEKIRYVTPELADILDVTYGCLVYQEQVMQIVRDLAGYSYGRSDLVRRAMSKKKTEEMLKEKEYFINGKTGPDESIEIAGCLRNGISREAAEAIFADMETFAQYAFNKSHAAAYAVVAYETGWLKKYYPAEFMAALLSSVMGDAAQTSRYIRNCEAMGIHVLPPDVNVSDRKYTVVDGNIRFGLRGVKNVGDGAIEEIIRARREHGLPKDIFRFIDNLDVSLVNKKAVESLIKAGALDSLDPNRAAHLAVYEQLMTARQNDVRKNIAGQISLFQISSAEMNEADTTGKLPAVRNFDKRILLSLEKEMLGIYVSGHPLDEYADTIHRFASITSRDLAAAVTPEEEEEGGFAEGGFDAGAQGGKRIYDGMVVTMAGMVEGKKTLITKSNKMMAFVDLEDLDGVVEVIVFPNVYERCHDVLFEDSIIAVRGRLNFKEGEVPKLLADNLVPLEDAEELRKGSREGLRGGPRGGQPYDTPSRPDVPDGAYSQAVDPEHAYSRGERSYRKAPAAAPKAHAPSGPVLKIRIPQGVDEVEVLYTLEGMFRVNLGQTPVLVYLQDGKIVRSKTSVTESDALTERLAGLVGEDNVKVTGDQK